MKPEDLDKAALAVEVLRTTMLFGELGDNEECANPEAVQFLLLSIAALEQAQRYLVLASLKESQALGVMQRR